jgi:protoheme IX farnesyltransferase
MVVSSLLLIPLGQMGFIYIMTSVAAGGWFIFESYRLYREGLQGQAKNPMRLFHGSISYLTLLFVAVAVDPLLHF